MRYYLYIKQCRDEKMWYAGMVGKCVPYLGIWKGDAYRSMEPEGYINRVEFLDADIVRITEEGEILR